MVKAKGLRSGIGSNTGEEVLNLAESELTNSIGDDWKSVSIIDRDMIYTN
jgi:hypothetical protein